MKDKMNVVEAAKYLDIGLQSLRNMIFRKSGPRHCKYMGRLYFDKKDLDAFKRSKTEVRAS